ncbi:MAG: phospholipase D family protein [Sedimenticola sp.]|nr:phospholipase D family protein [Sedimenticola sp.]
MFLLMLPGFSCATVPILQELAEESAKHSGQSGVLVLEQGEQSLLTRAWLTEQATRSIDVQYFIWSTDNIGTLSSEALLRAAERGIKVRIIVDDLLIDAEPETLLSLVDHPNVSIRIYNPRHSVGVSWWERLWQLFSEFRASNQRMHDKSVIYDGRVAITGGRNMADEYYDYDHDYNFRDRDVLVTGPVVIPMSASFERFWNSDLAVPLQQLLEDELQEMDPAQPERYRAWLHAYAQDETNFAPEVRAALADIDRQIHTLAGELVWTEVLFISDAPGKNSGKQGLGGGGATTSALTTLLSGARERITIQSPYLVMPEGGLELFRDLVRRGIEVRIITNSLASTDNLQAFSGYHKQRQAIIDSGIQLHEFRPDAAVARSLMQRSVPLPRKVPVFALHAKSLVVDGRLAYIGTFNFDPRSSNLNTEVGVIIDDRQVAGLVEQAILRDMQPQNSWQPAQEDPEADVGLWKRSRLWFWRLWPLDPLL